MNHKRRRSNLCCSWKKIPEVVEHYVNLQNAAGCCLLGPVGAVQGVQDPAIAGELTEQFHDHPHEVLLPMHTIFSNKQTLQTILPRAPITYTPEKHSSSTEAYWKEEQPLNVFTFSACNPRRSWSPVNINCADAWLPFSWINKGDKALITSLCLPSDSRASTRSIFAMTSSWDTLFEIALQLMIESCLQCLKWTSFPTSVCDAWHLFSSWRQTSRIQASRLVRVRSDKRIEYENCRSAEWLCFVNTICEQRRTIIQPVRECCLQVSTCSAFLKSFWNQNKRDCVHWYLNATSYSNNSKVLFVKQAMGVCGHGSANREKAS